MKRRRYYATFTVEIEVADALCRSVLTDEWRAVHYDLRTREDVAGHLAFNLMRGAELSSLDGFADQDPKRVKLIEIMSGEVEESEL